MIVKKIRIRTLAKEWFSDHCKLEADIHNLNEKKRTYDDVIFFLKDKYTPKQEQLLSDRTALK